MSVAVVTLGCDRKAESLYSWDSLFDLEGEYSLYFNYEAGFGSRALHDARRRVEEASAKNPLLPFSFDVWTWDTTSGSHWRNRPKFDQDQARLAPIVCARNMGIEYAMQTDASHLLFIDADIIPPKDIIPKLLQVNKLTVGGLVNGRGDHSSATYIFGEKQRFWEGTPQYQLTECEHGNIGYCMIARRAFEQVRFRYGTSEYPDGRNHMVSDDPAYHLDVFMKFHEWHYIRMDVKGDHIGDLKGSEAAQF